MAAQSEKYQAEPLAGGFLESCRKFPEKNAIYVGDQFYSYEALLEKVEIVFEQLSKKNPTALIGVYTSESIWTYAAILAISLSGACYLPLNPKFPVQKLLHIAESADLELILSGQPLLFADPGHVLLLDTQSKARKSIDQLTEQPLAYLLFTSGTTGQPKGVPVSKKNAAAFFRHYQSNFDFNEHDKFLQPYELSFDVSVFSLFAALNVGACVYVVPESGFKYLNVLNVILSHGITVSSMVPTLLFYLEKYLDGLTLPSLRYSFFSGDKLYSALALKWQNAANNCRIHNCYGPTETTIVCTSYAWENISALKASVNGIVPLGKPFENIKFLLVNEKNEPVEGTSGELCFTGAQVIENYLNGSNEDSFFTIGALRYYKTGDLASLDENGDLIFHGRADTQVKINGYRVELAEIENAIFQLIKKNAVVLVQQNQEPAQLVAFIEGDKADEQGLRAGLKEMLPAYMLPTRIDYLHAFPKNANDKIDRERLKKQIYE